MSGCHTATVIDMIAGLTLTFASTVTRCHNGRLSELIALAEAGLQAEEAEDDTGRLSELIALAEAGLQAEKDDDVFFTQAAEAKDKAETAYYRQQADQGSIGSLGT